MEVYFPDQSYKAHSHVHSTPTVVSTLTDIMDKHKINRKLNKAQRKRDFYKHYNQSKHDAANAQLCSDDNTHESQSRMANVLLTDDSVNNASLPENVSATSFMHTQVNVSSVNSSAVPINTDAPV